MKILMILATGALFTFPMDQRVEPDCFSQGHAILEKLATYHGPKEKGEDQGWVLNGSDVQVAGWYCK
tara:strand:+ start:514 stop:714 length:201 start_codon:yes stop_codon:yes gene_type:complete